jgi:ActR/RegA family two-component response regulator
MAGEAMERRVKEHILLVDDNASLNRSLALVLEHRSYAMTTARDDRGPSKRSGPTALTSSSLLNDRGCE